MGGQDRRSGGMVEDLLKFSRIFIIVVKYKTYHQIHLEVHPYQGEAYPQEGMEDHLEASWEGILDLEGKAAVLNDPINMTTAYTDDK